MEDKAALLYILLRGLLYFTERSKASEKLGGQDNHFSDFEILNDPMLPSLEQLCVRKVLQLRFL